MRRYFAFGANLSPAALTLRLGRAPGPEPSRAAALQDGRRGFGASMMMIMMINIFLILVKMMVMMIMMIMLNPG